MMPHRTKSPPPTNAAGRNFGDKAKSLLVVLALIVIFPLGAYLLANFFTEKGYSPIGLFGAPVFAKEADGDRVYLLTGQWRTLRTPGRHTSGYTYTNFYVDLWALDAPTATPLWRKRLESEREGGFIDRTFLGADNGVLWVLLHGKLVGLSAKDGSVVAPAGHVESLNPELKGLMPVDERYINFDWRGLHITAADARVWRVDPVTFKVSAATVPNAPVTGVFPPEFITPGSSGLHLVRGIDVPDHWLGLLTDEEAKTFEQNNSLGGMTPEVRRRLWGGRAVKSKNLGEPPDYSELEPLPAAPDFLDGGLLREYTTTQQLEALWAREPDSVFVLHRERLGEAGKFHLSRVSGPEGVVLWEATLPLTIVQSVKRMDSALMIFGREYLADDPTITEALRDSPQRLVSVDIASGAVHVHSHSALPSHLPAEAVDVGL